MKTTHRTHARLRASIAPLLAAALSIAAASPAHAQPLDVSPPLPNVLVLLDTSGSMEKMTNGADPESDPAARCVPFGQAHNGATTVPNRWGIAVQALTGDFSPGYSCVSMPRGAGSAFDTEYKIAGRSPYDVDYYLPYHRPAGFETTGGITTACLVGPGRLPGLPAGSGGAGGSATDFLADSIVTKTYNGAATATACTLTQLENGMFDSARDLVRFGLMTFDNDPGLGVGVTRTATPQIIDTAPFAGQWSYFLGWKSNDTAAAKGRPNACLTDSFFEVGARNQAAPPWEGRMFGFPSDPNAPIGTIQTHNDRIQLAVNAVRPYGATPIAGMMQDARTYFWDDAEGPEKTDPYVRGRCRKQYMILITDGAPNLDLRPQCTPEGGMPQGHCPFRTPEDTARELLLGTFGQQVKTYVVGFAVSGADGSTPANCADLARDRDAFAATCASTDTATQSRYAACCAIDRIATAGGSSAHFVENPRDLSNALSSILADIVTNTTTRTTPAYSPMVTVPEPGVGTSNASLYLASFLPSVGSTWKGTVQRQRYRCDEQLDPQPQLVDETAGDDFERNLNQGAGGPYAVRQFIVAQPTAVNATVDAKRTIRPFAETVTDGVATEGATVTGPVEATNVLSALTPEALEIGATSCANQLNNRYLTAEACKRMVLNFALGQPSTDPMPDTTFKPYVSRADNAFGAIFHSTPVVVGPPNALIRDESYAAFRTETIAQSKRNVATRKTVLYTATNDGLLHAFDVGVSGRERNEIWAFMPPAVMPKLRSLYPAGAPILLDGAPVVRDVVWERRSTDTDPSSKWHTMLTAGFGGGTRGYYALDVTDPERPPPSGAGGPQFRWQLTTMPREPNSTVTKQIFGTHSGTPAIGTIYADLNNGAGLREYGVAILPGGADGGPVGNGTCQRFKSDASPAEPPLNSDFGRNNSVRCWGATGQAVAGRSVSIVRIDTGEILRVFTRRDDAPTDLLNADRVTDTDLDSPMTGVPVTFPTTVGSVTQRFFMGDADGTVWRFDISSTDPLKWRGDLFFDTANKKVNANDDAQIRQPIVVAPVLALDPLGQLVLQVATGEQETFTSTGTNFIYSLTEKLDTAAVGEDKAALRAELNWYMQFDNGERVTGPMAVYDSVTYFATYAPAPASQVCGGGTARLWGRDYVVPRDLGDRSRGGVLRFKPDPTAAEIPEFYSPPGVEFAGKIIPGVSINITPTCTTIADATDDPYIPGASHYQVSGMNPGRPSLLAQVGGKNAQGQPLRFEASLPRPTSPTSVDSWATVVE